MDQEAQPAERALSFEPRDEVVGEGDPLERRSQHELARMEDERLAVVLDHDFLCEVLLGLADVDECVARVVEDAKVAVDTNIDARRLQKSGVVRVDTDAAFVEETLDRPVGEDHGGDSTGRPGGVSRRHAGCRLLAAPARVQLLVDQPEGLQQRLALVLAESGKRAAQRLGSAREPLVDGLAVAVGDGDDGSSPIRLVCASICESRPVELGHEQARRRDRHTKAPSQLRDGHRACLCEMRQRVDVSRPESGNPERLAQVGGGRTRAAEAANDVHEQLLELMLGIRLASDSASPCAHMVSESKLF
jgi:hypothetical protein